MEELVRKRLQQLQALAVAELCALPASTSEEVEVDGRKITVGVWHDVLLMGEHRIVVQAIKERWGGITAKVIAQGFELSGSGAMRALAQEELYDFT